MSQGTRIGFAVAALALVVGVGVLVWARRANAAVGNLQLYQGSAEIVREGRTIGGKTGTPVRLNDIIKSGPGSITSLVLKDGSAIRLAEGSEAAVAELEYRGEKLGRARFRLTGGRLWSRVAPLDAGARFEVETPTVVAAVQGTSFNTDYREAVSAVYTYRDRVSAALTANRGQTATVASGHLLRVRDAAAGDDFAVGPQLAPPEFFDEWISFNQAEDDALEGGPLPSPSPSPSPTPSEEPSPAAVPTKPSQVSGALTARSSPVAPPPVPAPTPTPSPTAPPKKLRALTLTVAQPVLNVGESTALSVVARYSDKTKGTATMKVSWSQSENIGTIAGGTFTADRPGTTTVTATLQGITANPVTIEVVKPRTLTELKVSYAVSSESSAASSTASTAQFTASAAYSDGSTEDVTKAAGWRVEPPASGSITADGFYTAGQVPGDTITASYGGFSSSVKVDL